MRNKTILILKSIATSLFAFIVLVPVGATYVLASRLVQLFGGILERTCGEEARENFEWHFAASPAYTLPSSDPWQARCKRNYEQSLAILRERDREYLESIQTRYTGRSSSRGISVSGGDQHE
jgi:hypothetical protein